MAKFNIKSKSGTVGLTIAIITLATVFIIGTPCALFFGIDKSNYDTARVLEDNGELDDALGYYAKVIIYGNKAQHIESIKEIIKQNQTDENYQAASNYLAEKSYQSAINIFEKLGDYKDSLDKLQQAKDLQKAADDARAAEAKAKSEAAAAEKARVAAEAKAKADAEAAENAWKSIKYFVSAHADSAICIRSTPDINGGKCKQNYYSDSGTNVIDYIDKGSSQTLENLGERQQSGDGHWWYKVRLGYSGRSGWVRDDVVKGQ